MQEAATGSSIATGLSRPPRSLVAASVKALSLTAVKGTRLRTVDRIELGLDGAKGNRRFVLIDERNHLLNAKRAGELEAIVADYAEEQRHLTLTFPDGRIVDGPVGAGDPIRVRLFVGEVPAQVLDGPWSQALSDFVGRSVRIARADTAVDRGARGTVSLVSSASVIRLAEVAGQPAVDPRRFRMLVEVDGLSAHEEDDWVGREVRVGEAIVRFNGNVGRCLVTSRDPDTGKVDLPTLEILREYRRELDTTEPLPFGIYGEVVRAGIVRVGDEVRAAEYPVRA
jgi:uncharacterized protein YcbX